MGGGRGEAAAAVAEAAAAATAGVSTSEDKEVTTSSLIPASFLFPSPVFPLSFSSRPAASTIDATGSGKKREREEEGKKDGQDDEEAMEAEGKAEQPLTKVAKAGMEAKDRGASTSPFSPSSPSTPLSAALSLFEVFSSAVSGVGAAIPAGGGHDRKEHRQQLQQPETADKSTSPNSFEMMEEEAGGEIVLEGNERGLDEE